MRIGLDVLGGDFAPIATLHGAIMALKEGDSVASIARLEGKGGSNNTKEAAAAPESAPQGPTPAKPPAAKKQSSPKK